MGRWRRKILEKMRPIDWVLLLGVLIFGVYHGARLAWAAISSVPNTLVYQGHLTSAGGTPVTAGTYDIKLEFYDAATSGTLLCDWTSTNIRVNANGNFRAEIGGSGSGSCTDIQATIRDNGALYLALSVRTSGEGAYETLSPRIKVGGVPRAHHAQNSLLTDMVTTVTEAPASGDCDNSSEYGRLRVDSTNYEFYFCTSGGWNKAALAASSTGTSTFTSTGNSTFTVPAGVTSLTIKMWGGGGGAGAAGATIGTAVLNVTLPDDDKAPVAEGGDATALLVAGSVGVGAEECAELGADRGVPLPVYAVAAAVGGVVLPDDDVAAVGRDRYLWGGLAAGGIIVDQDLRAA